MQIDRYGFGWIIIDGTRYEKDVIIADARVHPNWRRRKGHHLAAGDLDIVLAAGPGLLIVGTGKAGLMSVSPRTRRFLAERGIRSEVYDTAEACRRFNALTADGTDVTAALHLTC